MFLSLLRVLLVTSCLLAQSGACKSKQTGTDQTQTTNTEEKEEDYEYDYELEPVRVVEGDIIVDEDNDRAGRFRSVSTTDPDRYELIYVHVAKCEIIAQK